RRARFAVDLRAGAPHVFDNPAIVNVAAGRRVEAARDDERDQLVLSSVEGLQPSLVRGRCDMRFVERDAKALDSASAGAELAAADCRGETIEYRSREHFRRRIPPFERRLIVEV